MADKEFTVRKGLVVANTLIVASGSNVGINNSAPTHTLSVNGNGYIGSNLTINGTLIPTVISANSSNGTAGQVLTSSATGLYWSSTTASPPGSNTQIAFNDSGSFGASAGATFDKAANNLLIANTVNAASHTTGATGTGTGGVIANVTTVFIGNNTINATLNTTGLNINATTIANTTGVYTTGTVNAASHTVGASFTANSTLVNAVSIVTSTNTVTFGTTVYVVAGGNVGISNTTPADKLHVQGNIIASGDITSAYSDERLKIVTGPITNALEKVNSLIGFYYKPSETALQLHINDELKVGVSAQQVQKVLPEIVKPSAIDPKYLTVQYEKLVPLLIEAIKELTVRIEKLENGS